MMVLSRWSGAQRWYGGSCCGLLAIAAPFAIYSGGGWNGHASRSLRAWTLTTFAPNG